LAQEGPEQQALPTMPGARRAQPAEGSGLFSESPGDVHIANVFIDRWVAHLIITFSSKMSFLKIPDLYFIIVVIFI
jgi:hypothetical protein